MCKRTASDHPAGDLLWADDAAGEGFASARGVLGRWRERMRQRRELAAMSPHDLAGLGIPPGLAAYETGRWPWQKISPAWRLLDGAPAEELPSEPPAARSPRSDRDRDRPLAPSAAARWRE